MLSLVALLAVAFAGLVPVAHAEDEPTSKAAQLLKQGDDTFRTRKYAEATELYKEAIAAARKEGATETLVEALAMAARGHLIRGEGPAGQTYLDGAAQIATDTQPQGWSRFLGVRGRFEWKVEKDHPKATKTFEAMHAYCQKHELWRRAVDAAHMVAITGTKEQQVAWGLKGIEAAEKGSMEGWLGPLWNNLGNSYQERGENKKALDAFLKARHYHWKGTGEHRKLVADWAVGMAYRKLGELDKAKQWLRPVLAWAERRYAEKEEAERGEWIGLACMELGLVALAEKRHADAKRDLDRAHPLLAAVKMHEWHPVAWKELMDARATLSLEKVQAVRAQFSNFSSAIDVYRLRTKKLPDSLEVLTETDGRNPYPIMKRIPIDAWGHAYEYRILDRGNYELRSYGPDGEPDTDDDLTFSTK